MALSRREGDDIEIGVAGVRSFEIQNHHHEGDVGQRVIGDQGADKAHVSAPAAMFTAWPSVKPWWPRTTTRVSGGNATGVTPT